MIYEYLLCMINGATGGTTLQLKGNIAKEGTDNVRGLCWE